MLDQLLSEDKRDENREISMITLYVGAHKTATTHFQGILHANNQRLLENNIKLTMPGNVRKEWLPALFHYCNHHDDTSKHKVYSLAPQKGRWLLTEENIVGVSNDFTNLSGIYPKAKKRLACIQEIFTDTPMELFFSLRSYETFYRSAYSEVIRNRGYIPFEQFYNEERFRDNSWVDTIRAFTEVIPQEKITIWRYEDFRGLVPELLERMTGIHDTKEMINAYKAERTRPSLSQKTIDILDSLYPVLKREESLKLVERINNVYPVGEYASLNPFSEEDNERLKEQYHQDIQIILNEFPKINFIGMNK